MNLAELLISKELKPKEKTETISNMLLEDQLKVEELVEIAAAAKDPVKATCIEALEFATKKRPAIATLALLLFVTESLNEKPPRVKWESAKVIGNIAHLFPENITEATTNLLANAEHTGTVVRWSAAFALGEILKTAGAKNPELLPALETVCGNEEKNSIKKLYQNAFKKVKM